MNPRLNTLRNELKEQNLFAMLVTSYENYRYFSGFTGSNCTLVITERDAVLITDGRYTEQAKIQAPDFEIISKQGTQISLVSEILSTYCGKNVGYETMKISDYTLCRLKEALPNINWCPVPNFALSARSVKDSRELEHIKKAVAVADEALGLLIPQIKEGMTEREIAALLEYNMASLGSEKCAFDTIVASGVRSSLPHASPTDKKIERGDLITLDFGACVNGYMSDITRTIWLGEPSDKLKELYFAVKDVQSSCAKKIAPGVLAKEIDSYQRAEFEKLNLSQYICHSLGHGVGLEIHESPTLSRLSDEILKPGMVVTVEPGLYVPRVGGVRIEDTVLVTEDGFEVLTQSPHHIAL